jgi:arylsulfatase
MDASLDELGGPTTQGQHQRPWAYLGATPYRRYKLWPYAGGVRTPLIVSWPGHVADPGSVRTQRVDVIDLAPTLVEAAGARFSPMKGGVAQLPVAGRSIGATFRSKTAPAATSSSSR